MNMIGVEERQMATDITANAWRCPRCRGSFYRQRDWLVCTECQQRYPILAGIADLRVDIPAWVDVAADRERALRLLALPESTTAADLAFHVYKSRPGWSDQRARRRCRQAMVLADRMARECDGWLRRAASVDGPLLDLGCGSGGLLAAVARRGATGLGVDVSLEWLVVAHRVIREHGGEPVLAAAMAEALPLADGSLAAIISLDVIEHVGDQGRYLSEIDRVLDPSGVCALVTPNRFSLTPEPHVGVWGVGWLPRRWQRTYVRWRRGIEYDYCVLLSAAGLRRLFNRRTSLRIEISAGEIPIEEIQTFSRYKAFVARTYNRFVRIRGLRAVLLGVCPFFRVMARRDSDCPGPATGIDRGAPYESTAISRF